MERPISMKWVLPSALIITAFEILLGQGVAGEHFGEKLTGN